MPNAATNASAIAVIPEVTWGTTPASALTQLNFNSFTPNMEQRSTKSGHIVTQRGPSDFIRVGARGGGEFATDFQYGALDSVLESLMSGAWTAEALSVGSTRKSLTLEAKYGDIGQYSAFKGAIANRFAVSVAGERPVVATVGFSSKFPVWNTATHGSGPYVAPSTEALMDPIASVQLIQDGGAGSVLGVSEYSFELSNGLIELPVLGSVDPFDILLGEFNANGEIVAYFADRTYLDKFINWTDSSLSFKLGGVSAKNYTFLFNKIKYTQVGVPIPGPNGAVTQRLRWDAKHDATNTICKITRDPS